MRKTFRSNGKLLLTGEYFVLGGAKALALPTKKGQSLNVSYHDQKDLLEWKSYDVQQNRWFEAGIKLHFKVVVSTDETVAKTLVTIVKACKEMNPLFNPFGKKVETFLEFPNDWGLGSSSTLINNIAQWANVNPFELLWKSFSGSGYDIANASHDTPIVYSVNNKIPFIEEVVFVPSFKNDLYFIHLNEKQNSREGIQHYKSQTFDKEGIIKKINDLTSKILNAKSLDEFEAYIKEHETIISTALKIEKVQDQLFPDYTGVVKSLGAWGGDFVLVTFREGMELYFKSKGYETIISFNEMIK